MGRPSEAHTVEENSFEAYRISSNYLHMVALNECLRNHPEDQTRNIMAQLHVQLSFDLTRFWFCLTGVKKDVYHGVYQWDAADYLKLFDRLRDRLKERVAERGYRADIFMITADESKQAGILFSAGENASCTPAELAEQLGAICQEVYEQEIFHGDTWYCNTTALSVPLSGLPAIRAGYLQARQLSDLSFFRMEPGVITEARAEALRGGADYPTVIDQCYQLAQALDEGDGPLTQRRLDKLFTLLRGSLSVSLCRDALSCCKNLIQVRHTVFGGPEGLDLERLCGVEHYLKIEECHAALSAVFADLCAAIHAHGPCYRAAVLAMYFIHKNYARDISIQDVAQYANVTPTYLSGIFPKNTGLVLRDYITARRIEAAKKLLADRELRVADVAEAVGIHDSRYFARIFKKQVGMTPGEYRERSEG